MGNTVEDPNVRPTAMEYWRRCMARVMAKEGGDHVSTRVVLRLPEQFDLNAKTVPLLVARAGNILIGGEGHSPHRRMESSLCMSLACCADILGQYTIRKIALAKTKMEQRLLEQLERHTFWLEPGLAPCAVEAVTDLSQYMPVRLRGSERLVEGGNWINLMLHARDLIDPESAAGKEFYALLDYERLMAEDWRARVELGRIGSQLVEVERVAKGVRLPPPPSKKKDEK